MQAMTEPSPGLDAVLQADAVVLEKPEHFVLDRLTDVMEAAGKKCQPRTVYYALAGAEVTHPDCLDGRPFRLDGDALVDWLASYMGGGKSLFKIYASLQRHRVGTMSKALQRYLTQAGFLSVTPGKAQV